MKSTFITLKELEPYTKYIIRALTFTGGGDGPWSSPISCITNEDGQ